MKKNLKLIISIFILLIILILFLIFKNLSLGYYKQIIIYDFEVGSQTVELGVPKLSFMSKVNDKSYSYKNIRDNRVLTKEIKKYLNTLNQLKCNNTIYYYDNKNDFTIIDYSVKNNILYNTISYEVRYGDYCFSRKIDNYSKKLGGIKRYHGMNNKYSISEDKEFTPILVVGFLDDVDIKKQKFTATMKVEYLYPIPNVWQYVSKKEIEQSSGIYEIKDNKLYYTRTNIEKAAEDIDIPEVSVFEIKDQKLVLMDNYLEEYDKNIILQ